ncbi:SHC-transforming protein 2 isoform X2 [Monodon monoceros]|uniref:SHC-transforming protein 2 isoform X2 n=1 Tax=Monodon monoceros TaxID=40151 RepID=UPI0010F4695D|nr:SHC-transforming protein 2 isoform X2 [Monodon monoceros]
MGCIEVLRSMRSLDFSTRTQLTREAINRLHEAVPGIRGSWKKKAPNKALASILGKSNLRFAGMSIAVSISIDGLNLSVPATHQRQPRDWWSLFGQIIASHHMQSISFASGGDTDMVDYVAYVAKDPINQRACHILECCEGLAQSVISTVGQAFELRFKQYLHSPPRVVVPPGRLTGLEDSAWGDEDETEHSYYNRTPGKEPPLGGLVDSRLTPAQQPCALGALGQGASPARRDARGPQWDVGPSGTASRGSKHQSIKRHPVKSQSPCPICFIHLPNQVTAVSSYHVFSRILHAHSSQLRHTWLSPVFRRWRAIYPSTLLSPRNSPAWNPPHVRARQSPPFFFTTASSLPREGPSSLRHLGTFRSPARGWLRAGRPAGPARLRGPLVRQHARSGRPGDPAA